MGQFVKGSVNEISVPFWLSELLVFLKVTSGASSWKCECKPVWWTSRAAWHGRGVTKPGSSLTLRVSISADRRGYKQKPR
jgi:hypothetical protein